MNTKRFIEKYKKTILLSLDKKVYALIKHMKKFMLAQKLGYLNDISHIELQPKDYEHILRLGRIIVSIMVVNQFGSNEEEQDFFVKYMKIIVYLVIG